MTSILHRKLNERNKPKPKIVEGKPEKNKTTRWLASNMHNIELRNALMCGNFNNLYEAGFIKAYISDHSREVLHDNHLYYLFNPVKFTRNFERFIQSLETSQYFAESYDIRPTDMGKVMVVMQIPDKWEKLRGYFLEGAYSLFPDDYMKVLVNTQAWMIWCKDPDYKKSLEIKIGQDLLPTAELESIPFPYITKIIKVCIRGL